MAIAQFLRMFKYVNDNTLVRIPITNTLTLLAFYSFIVKTFHKIKLEMDDFLFVQFLFTKYFLCVVCKIHYNLSLFLSYLALTNAGDNIRKLFLTQPNEQQCAFWSFVGNSIFTIQMLCLIINKSLLLRNLKWKTHYPITIYTSPMLLKQCRFLNFLNVFLAYCMTATFSFLL